jgi:integrase
VDLKRRFLVVSETLSEVRGHLVFGESKTPAARRRVPLPASLVADLEAHRHQFGIDDSDLLFTSTEGSPVRRGNFRLRHWLPRVRATTGELLRFHDLRHRHGAFLIAKGVDPKNIANRLGHKSVRTVSDYDGHAYPEQAMAAADSLDELRVAADVQSLFTLADSEPVRRIG